MTKYLNIYNRIIAKAKQEVRKKKQGIYYENHHILPRSLGGSNNKDNMVLLTAREHYLCHQLIFKHYYSSKELSNCYKMAVAFHRLSTNTKNKMNSKLYEKAKQVISKSMTGKDNPMFGDTRRRGTKVTDPNWIANMKKAGIRSRIYTDKLNWKNEKLGITELSISLHDLAEKYDLHFRNLIQVSKNEKKTHNGWSLLEQDTRNLYIRQVSYALNDWYNYKTGVCYTNCSIDDLLSKHPELKYETLRDILSNNTLNIEYKGWCLKHTYEKRHEQYQFTNTRLFTIWLEKTDTYLTGTCITLSSLTGHNIPVIRRIIKKGLQNIKTNRKPPNDSWLFIKEIK